MKKIYDFDSWLDEGETSGLTKKQVDFLDRYTKGKWTYDESTGLVDIDGYFNSDGRILNTLEGISFGRVTGHFNWPCDNDEFPSLQGAPREIGGSFDCKYSHLTTLEGAPQEVGGDFNCGHNDLKNLDGAPRAIAGGFACHGNPLESLVGAPESIGGVVLLGGDYSDPIIKIKKGGWNPQGWMEVFIKGDPEARALIATLPVFKQILDEHPEEFEDLSDLKDLGF